MEHMGYVGMDMAISRLQHFKCVAHICRVHLKFLTLYTVIGHIFSGKLLASTGDLRIKSMVSSNMFLQPNQSINQLNHVNINQTKNNQKRDLVTWHPSAA